MQNIKKKTVVQKAERLHDEIQYSHDIFKHLEKKQIIKYTMQFQEEKKDRNMLKKKLLSISEVLGNFFG